MTWFKSLIMRQNSPILLIDPKQASNNQHKDKQEEFFAWKNYNSTRNSNLNSKKRTFSEATQVRFSSSNNNKFKPASIDQHQDCPKHAQAHNYHHHRLPDLVSFTSPSQQEVAEPERQPTSQLINNYFKLQRRPQMEARMLIWCAWFCLFTGTILLTFLSSQALAASSSSQYFEVEPEAQYLVENGHEVRLRCLVRNRQGECLWLKNKRVVGPISKKYQYSKAPEDGDCSLLVKNVSVQQDDAIWNCQVFGSDIEQDNSLESRDVHLVVLVAPERAQIKNTTQGTQRLVLEENKSRTIVCEIRGGNPAPQIEWLLDNKNITKEASTSLLAATQVNQRITRSSLKLADIKRSMNGKNLTCVGVHQTGSQSTSVELDVQYVPTVSVVQREYSIVEGSPLSISCQVDSNPPPSFVNWRLVSDGVSQKTSTAPGVITPARPGPVLEFERISRDLNQNVFECMAQNSYGISLPADIKLNVLYAPFLINTSHSESVMLGSQAQLACNFDGNPEPEVKWHFLDPLSRSALAQQLDNNKQQLLTIKNITYRNEGDYHCEAKNQINGVFYGVRSSSITLDVYGEPQFLVKSPAQARAVQGSKSDVALTFCSDPVPQRVYWQFGSLRLEVRLSNINGQLQSAPVAPSVGKHNNPVAQRYQAHPLQALQKRDSSFSKTPTCFEATLSIMEPDVTDQRDYTLVVHNERGTQSAVVRLKISAPLSPGLMITAAFGMIFGLFLCALIVMFLVKKRNEHLSSSSAGNHHGGHQNGSASSITRSEKNGVEHLVNGNVAANGQAAVAQQLMQQQTRNGIVNGTGNGVANNASNPNVITNSNQLASEGQKAMHFMSMASSDTSGDQKQLLASSDRHSSGSSNQGALNSPRNSNRALSSNNSTPTPTPMSHISVEEQLEDASGLRHSLLARHSTRSSLLAAAASGKPIESAAGLIYANLDYTDHANSLQHSPASQHQEAALANHSPSSSIVHQDLHQRSRALDSPHAMRPSVGATIAMMNSLAAANQVSSTPSAGVLNGAINQQLANSRQLRKPGPPKPPKPSIQQRNRFYQQQQANGLVMIGSLETTMQGKKEPTANELAVEYSRIAFPARAEL